MKRPLKLSDGEKLIVLMLSEIYDHLKIKGGLDAKLVASAVMGGHLWAIGHEIQFLGQEDVDESIATEVADIFGMWERIELSFAALAPADADRVKKEGYPYSPRFPGFDGNNEGAHYGAARFWTRELDLFEHFKGHDLNSHGRSLPGYRAMLKLYGPIRDKLSDRRDHQLTPDEIIELLKARPAVLS